MPKNQNNAQILLLDNDKIEFDYWQKWLKLSNWNVQIHFASTIEEAIDFSLEINIDIYLIDLFLDGESGFDFLEYIKNKRGLKLVLTSSSNTIDVQRSCELGAFLLNKQSDNTKNLQLIQMIRSLWELGKVPSEDYILNRSGVENIVTKIGDVGSVMAGFKEELNDIKKQLDLMEAYIMGDYEKNGLRQEIDHIKHQLDDSNFFVTLLKGVIEIGKENKFVGLVILLLVAILTITIPIILIGKIID